MTAKCKHCNDTKIEPGEGPCIWCKEIGPAASGTVERFTIATLRYAGGAEHDVRYVSEVHYDAALAERNALQQLLNVADERADGFDQRIARLRHVGMELTGVIDEYRAMPCDSLEVRMFNTADRYRKRITAKCGNCEDHGVIGYSTGQTPESFDQGEYPCPECHPTEYAAWSKP